MKKFRIFCMLLLPAMLLCASQQAGHEAAGAHHVDWISLLGKVFNSTVLFGGLALLLRKPLINMLSERGSAVAADFQERAKNLVDTTVQLEVINRRLQQVALEVEQMKNSAISSGQQELARLEAAGREEAARIVAMSEEEIQLRVDAAVRTLKGHIADLAIERFRESFSKSLDASTQQKIIERNIAACEKLGVDARPRGGIDEGK